MKRWLLEDKARIVLVSLIALGLYQLVKGQAW